MNQLKLRDCNNVGLFALAGDPTVVTVDNTPPPGGDQRTIGYWRNWSCGAKGRQSDEVSGKLPITLGSFTVTTCTKAVAILSNPSMKYAEHGLAAQLLAAKLNVAAEAGTCTASTEAIAAADTLLTGIGWNGNQNTKIVDNKHPQRGAFVLRHGQLDAYNRLVG